MTSNKIDTLIRNQMRLKNVPGLALSAVQDGKVIYAKGFGCRNLKRQEPMGVDTLIGIGSISKSFTAFAIMILQDRGKLNIEDSVSDYLKYELFTARPEIKIKHILSHSSGIPSLDAGMLDIMYAFDDFSKIYPASNRDDFMAHLADAEEFILYQPGKTFFYNNDMYTCLSFIIEAISGLNFDAFVQKEILEPLEMHRAVFTRAGLEADDNAMTGYRYTTKDGKRRAVESEVPIDGALQAPGGLYVSMREMLNYAQCLLGKGVFKGRRILSEASLDLLFSGQISTPYGKGDDPKYALGWSVERSEEVPYIVLHHGGGMETSTSFLMLVPEINLGVVAAENAGTGVCMTMCRALVQQVIGQDPQGLEELRLAKTIEDISGIYKSAYGMYEFKVGLIGGILQADVETDDGAFSFPLLPGDMGELSFMVYSLRPGNKSRTEFLRDKLSGKISHVRYDRFLYARL